MRRTLIILGLGLALAALRASPACAQDASQSNGQTQNQNGAQDQNSNQNGNNGTTGANGQPTQPEQPEQPIATPGSENNGGDANTIPAVVTPNMTPSLASTTRPSFDLPAGRSYVQFRVDFFNTLNTNAQYLSGGSNNGLANTQSLLGGVTLEKVGVSNELKAQYLGGESFSTDTAIGDSTVQLFGLADKWNTARWSGSFEDQLSYLSDPIFTGSGFDPYGLGFAGINLQMAFQPTNQTLLTARTPTLDNSAAAEVDYQMSPRASFTIAGGYFLVHYYGPDLINTNSSAVQVGYNYQLSARNTVGALYRFDEFGSGGSGGSIKDNIMQFTWGRRVAERLRFQVAIGPDVALLSSQGLPSATRVSWSLDSNLVYQRGLTTANVSYAHMLMGGYGLSLGSEVDSVYAGVARQMGKAWTVNATAGYVRNGSGGIALGTLVLPNANVNTTIVGAGISRTLWRVTNVFANYNVFYETASNLTTCATPPCQNNLTNQAISVGIGWHPKPIPLP